MIELNAEAMITGESPETLIQNPSNEFVFKTPQIPQGTSKNPNGALEETPALISSFSFDSNEQQNPDKDAESEKPNENTPSIFDKVNVP